MVSPCNIKVTGSWGVWEQCEIVLGLLYWYEITKCMFVQLSLNIWDSWLKLDHGNRINKATLSVWIGSTGPSLPPSFITQDYISLPQQLEHVKGSSKLIKIQSVWVFCGLHVHYNKIDCRESVRNGHFLYQSMKEGWNLQPAPKQS